MEASEKSVYEGYNSIGSYVECPECGAENMVDESLLNWQEEGESKEEKFFQEGEEDGLPEA